MHSVPLPALEAFFQAPDHDTFAHLSLRNKRVLVESAVSRFPRLARLIEVTTNPESHRSYALVAILDGDGKVLEYATFLVAFSLSRPRTLARSVHLENGSYRLVNLEIGVDDLIRRVQHEDF